MTAPSPETRGPRCVWANHYENGYVDECRRDGAWLDTDGNAWCDAHRPLEVIFSPTLTPIGLPSSSLVSAPCPECAEIREALRLAEAILAAATTGLYDEIATTNTLSIVRYALSSGDRR